MPDVILPVLNEADALPWVLGRMPDRYRPIVVDNGSDDGSGALAEELGALVVFEPRRGFGAACFRGLMESDADVVCFMDADASLDPMHLPLVAGSVISGDADLVLGRRRPERGAWPLHARLGNRAIAFELRRRAGVKLRDVGPMRAAPRAALLGLELADRRSGWPFEMVLRAAIAGWRIVEVPVPYQARIGRSKVTGTVRGTVQAVGDLVRVMR